MFSKLGPITLLALVVGLVNPVHAQPLPVVKVEDTQDRWITFGDGGRLTHGFEISPLLMQFLFESDKYILIAPGIDDVGAHGMGVMSLKNSPSTIEDLLKDRLPNINFTYLNATKNVIRPQRVHGMSVMSAGQMESPQAHIIIRPRVETLLYASGERSNRIVYGFAPDRLNPYNAGMPGQKDNEFTTTEYAKPSPIDGKICENVDFFGGQLNPLGWGPGLPNFGANSDEGIELFLFGYGFGFKKKTFDVKSELVFDVELPMLNKTQEFRYELKGGGKDIGVGFSYQGISIAVEVQRRNTLRMALQAMLTTIVDSFLKDIPTTAWSTQILEQREDQWLIPVGTQQGMRIGMALESTFKSKYAVTKIYDNYSLITPDPSNVFRPFVLETITLPNTELLLPLVGGARALAADSPAVASHDLGKLDLQDVVETLPPPETVCLKKKPSTWEKLLMGITWVYGYIRYKTVFDQSFESASILGTSDKIAVIASGIDPKEKKLKDSLDTSGFDFISWDNRPADELGMGTAAAILLKEKLKQNPHFVSLKVLTPFGSTHSSAVYQALVYAAERADIQTVIVPFKPGKDSQALRDGIKMLVGKGKLVVVPQGIKVAGAIEAPPTAEFTTKGLSGRKLRLSGVGSGVVEKLAQILNQNSKQ